MFSNRSSWVCASCTARKAGHRIQAYASVHRPANQKLSRDVAGKQSNKLSAGKVLRERLPVRKARSAVLPPRVSSSRMSKTGTSVLQPIPIHERTESKSRAKTALNFESLKLGPTVLKAIHTAALKDLEYAEPSIIQSLAIPPILQSARSQAVRTYLIAAETGSGKTLSYLAPVLQLLKDEESGDSKPERQVGRPRCIIMLPSTELVKQVGALVKAMSHVCKISSAVILPEFDFRRTKNQVLMSPIDILITMPFRLANLIEGGLLNLKNTSHVIIDEADTLLDVSFADSVRPLISKANNAKTLTFCSATIPRSVDNYLRKTYPNIERLVSPRIHSIPRRIATRFVDVPKDFKGDKNTAVHQILRDLQSDTTEPGRTKRVILFVNKREDVTQVAEFINSKGIKALPFSRDIDERERNIQGFLSQDPEANIDGQDGLPMQVLITTDLASRGIDTTSVKNVIIYDTPHSTIDLLHRIGRTGRAGRRGTAYILLSKKRGEQWIEDVKKLSIKGQPLI